MNPSRILSTSISTLLAFAAIASVGRAATKVWDGGATGIGTDLATAANWSGDTLPVANDILQWNGTAPGNLALTLNASTAFAANNGYFIDVTAAQTGSLQIDNVTTNVSTNGIRLRDITIASGAGAFTLGNGTGTSVVILGSATAPANANAWINNSATAATVASDVIWADGGAVAGRVLTFDGAGDWNMNSVYGITVVAGNGTLALRKIGTGTLFMNAASATYTAGTTIGAGGGAGVIRAGANQALGTGTVTLDTTGNASTARLELNSATGIGLNNAITFSGRNNVSVAIQNIAGNNTLSGVVTLSTGGSTYLVQSDAGTLTFSNATSITGGATTGTRTVTLSGAGNGVVGGAIINGTATVAITKDGAGTWTLNGTNTYTGPTNIVAGALQIGDGSVNGDLSTVSTITNNGTLILNRSGAGPFTNPNAISGTGALTKLGGATQILSGANSYSGATNINAGTLGFSTNAQSLGASAFTVADNAGLLVKSAAAGTTLLTTSSLTLGTSGPTTLTFDFSGLDSTVPLISTGAFSANGTVNVALQNGAALASGAHTLIDYTSFSGSGTFPTGTVVLGPRSTGSIVNDTANTVLNLTVTGDVPKWTGLDNGNWQVGATGANGNWKLITANTATDYIDGDAVLFDDTATGTSTINLTTTLSPAGITVNNTTGGVATYTFSAPGKISGGASLTKLGNGALVITNTTPNDNTGATTIGAGTVQIGDGATAGAGSLGGGGIAVDGTLVFNRPDAYTQAGAITGAGTVRKNQANTVTLTTAQNFGGTVNVTVGALQFAAISTLSGPISNAGTLTLSAGGSLSGAITNAGTIALTAGGTIPGTVNNTGAITLAAGGTISGGISGTGALNANGGTVVLNGGATNTFTGLTTVGGGTLQLNKSGGAQAIGGDILITGGGVLAILAPEQIADTATITFTGTSADSTVGTNSFETVANLITNPSVATGQFQMRFGFTVTGTATVNNGVLGVSSGSTATANAVHITGGILRIAGNTAASTLNVGPGGITASGGEIQVKFNTNNQNAVLNLGGDFTATGNVAITDAAYNGANLHIINLVGGARTFNIAAATTTTVAPDIGDGTLIKTGDGTLALNGKLGTTGAFTLEASDGLTAISESQTIDALNIGDGATVVLGPAPAAPAPIAAAAADFDGLGAASSFGEKAQVTGVPEPGSIGLLFAGACGLLARRRRAR